MPRTLMLSSLCALLCASLVTHAQPPSDPLRDVYGSTTAIETEVRSFYDAYAADLREHRRAEIAARYDPRGVFFLGHGRKTVDSFEVNRSFYHEEWTGPTSFEWRDLSVEVLSREAALVLGYFEWGTSSGDTSTVSYTGLVIKHHGAWRIRVEDESSECR